jgi:O-antigen ligase
MFKFFRKYHDYNDYLLLIVKIGLGLILFLPLVISSDFYFPFIAPRNFLFRFIIEIIFFIYLYLAWLHKDLRPKFNKGFWLLLSFILALTISSLFGQNFGFSFWSNFERMDGLLNWVHIVLYLIVLIGVLPSKKDWHIFFHISLISAWFVALIAVGQKLGLDFVIASSGGVRLTSTLGNAAYVGSYMMIHIVLLAYLFIINKQLRARIFYIVSSILFVFVLLNTHTRGAFLGLLLFIFLFGIFYLYFERKKRNTWYYSVLAIFIAGILFFSLLFAQQDSDWVKKVPMLGKVANISLTDITVQSRLMIWRNSFSGVVEKPILGWGEENFQYVFNKHFPIEIFHTLGSEVWFDRPHNILMQHLVQSGILGLMLYLSVFIYLIRRLYRKYKKDQQWLVPFLWVSFLLSFLFHDLFIFDSLNTNVILYLILGFLFVGDKECRLFEGRRQVPKKLVAIFCIILFFFVVNLFVVRPVRSNLLLVDAIKTSSMSVTEDQMNQALDKWQKSWKLSFIGDREKVDNLYRLAMGAISRPDVAGPAKDQIFYLTQIYMEEVSNRYPDDVRSNLFLANFYYNFAQFDPSFLDKNLALLEKLHNLAPQRPDLYLSLTDAYLAQGNIVEAKKIAQELVDLSPWVNGVYWNLMKVALFEKDMVLLGDVLDEISMLNMNKINNNFNDDEIIRLNNIVYQAEAQELFDIVEVIEPYLK